MPRAHEDKWAMVTNPNIASKFKDVLHQNKEVWVDSEARSVFPDQCPLQGACDAEVPPESLFQPSRKSALWWARACPSRHLTGTPMQTGSRDTFSGEMAVFSPRCSWLSGLLVGDSQ